MSVFQKNDGLGVKIVKKKTKKRAINPYLFYFFPHSNVPSVACPSASTLR